jgi:hypothetical protein
MDMARRRFLKKQAKSEEVEESEEPLSEDSTEPVAVPDRSQLYNRLAGALLILSPLLFLCYLLIFMVPTLPINPFKPLAQTLSTLAPTSTLQPTYTPTRTPTSTSTPTNTPRPTFTRTSTATPKPTLDFRTSITGTARAAFLATRTPTPTASPTLGPTQSPFNYTAEVVYQRAQLYGTNWSGIAGLIFGLDLKHQPGIGVKAWGDAPLGPEGQLLPSGTAPQYGPSGWEFTLGDRPVNGKYNVQLLGSNGEPISPIVEIDLKGDPRANLAYVIFRQNH